MRSNQFIQFMFPTQKAHSVCSGGLQPTGWRNAAGIWLTGQQAIQKEYSSL